jgi:hypothetical protein
MRSGQNFLVAGMDLGGKRIEFASKPSNYLEITTEIFAGSCPYLLSWNGTAREWVNHGKVLDRAPRKALTYTDVRRFNGFRGRFRLEEREPEIAQIDQARLIVTLKQGRSLTLAPSSKQLARRDGDHLRLMWGETADIIFRLPRGVRRADVVSSQIELTGYYRRYTSMVRRSTRGLVDASSPPISSRARGNGLAPMSLMADRGNPMQLLSFRSAGQSALTVCPRRP